MLEMVSDTYFVSIPILSESLCKNALVKEGPLETREKEMGSRDIRESSYIHAKAGKHGLISRLG